LNGEPARIDSYGRLWSSYLKGRFSVGTRVELSKNCKEKLVFAIMRTRWLVL